MPRRARIRYRMGRKHSGPGAGGRPCEPSPKGKNVKERAPRVGGDALSNPPGCGKWVGHDYNAPTSWRFQGSKKKEARPLSAAPPPAQAAARCAAELQICRLPANRFIPSDQKRGGLRVCDRGGSRLTVDCRSKETSTTTGEALVWGTEAPVASLRRLCRASLRRGDALTQS